METTNFGKKLFAKLQASLKTDDLLESLLNYLEVSFELIKLDTQEAISRILSKIATFIILVILVTLFVIFFSIALALGINYFLDTSSFVGFGAVAMFYLLIIAYFFGFGKKKVDNQIEEKVEETINKIQLKKNPENLPSNENEEQG